MRRLLQSPLPKGRHLLLLYSFHLALLLLFFLPTYGYSQDEGEQKSASEGLSPFLRLETFFRNNEYQSPYGTGYTLPGYRLSGALRYRTSGLLHGVDLQLGATVRSFFGAPQKSNGSWLYELHDFEDRAYNHFYPSISPLISIQLALSPLFTLAMGHYDTTTQPHFLPSPLYNKEFSFSAPPEAGVRLLLHHLQYKGDLWIDWQRFVYPREYHQEYFTAGLSFEANFSCSKQFSLGGALHCTMSHRGGEINQRDENYILRTYYAGLLGIQAQYHSPAESAVFPFQLRSALYLGGSLVGQDHLPKGIGYYWETVATYKHFSIMADYWRGKNFVSSMGGPFINSFARWGDTDPSSIVSFVHLAPKWDIVQHKQLQLGLSGEIWWHLLPRSKDKRISHALAIYLCYTPF